MNYDTHTYEPPCSRFCTLIPIATSRRASIYRSIDRSIRKATSLDSIDFSRSSSWTVREKRQSHPSPIITRSRISMSLLKGIASCGDLRHAAS